MDPQIREQIKSIVQRQFDELDKAAWMPHQTESAQLGRAQMIDASYTCLFTEVKLVLLMLDSMDDKKAWPEFVEILEEIKRDVLADRTKNCINIFLSFSKIIAKG